MQTFAALLAEQGRLEQPLAAGWLARLGKSLDDLHGRGLSHGALSPVALLVEGESPWSRGVLDAGTRAESLPYRSPERGETGPASPADDRYAWALLLHFAVTGALPDRDPTSGAHRVDLHAHGVQNPALQSFLAGCLAPQAQDRPTDTASLWDRMERMLGISSSLPLLETERGPLLPGATPMGEPTAPLPTLPGAIAPTRSFGGGLALLFAAASILALVVASVSGLRRVTEGRGELPREPLPAAPRSATPAFSAVPVGAVDLAAKGEAVSACVEKHLGGTFPDINTGFCRQHDLLVVLGQARASLKGTPAERKWDALGWYDVAALGAVQGRCCPIAPLPVLDAPPRCALTEPLFALQQVAKRPATEDDLKAPLAAYTSAAECTLGAGFSDARKMHRQTIAPAETKAFVAFFLSLRP